MSKSSIPIIVDAGNHDRNFCPVFYKLAKDDPVFKEKKIKGLSLRDEEGNKIPVQYSTIGNYYIISWILNNIKAGEKLNYLLTLEEDRDLKTGVEVEKGEEKLDFRINGNYLTSYVYDTGIAKPYLGKIISPVGNSYTRLDFEIEEHPHHRSVWVAIGDVDGVDFWNEPAGEYGIEHHREFINIVEGPVYGSMTSLNTWADFEGKHLVDEIRTITIYNTPPGHNFIDFKIKFRASYGKVIFGSTKEAGPLGVRLAESMKVNNGGTIINSYGSVNEKECWGQRAEWCDYYGQVEGEQLGITVFDFVENENYPSYWHVRDYGLMAPNNLYFLGKRQLQPGETLTYKYRMYCHKGDTEQARVAQHYQNYINPPEINQEKE